MRYRPMTTADIPAMAACRLTDPAAGPADTRMSAYLEGTHHPQQALLPRVGYVAVAGEVVIGYIAGHQTRRHGCEGEVQYLFVAPAFRRRKIALSLLRLLANWFQAQGVKKVCVSVDADSPSAQPFYDSVGASPLPLRPYWYAWGDIARIPADS